MNMNPICGRFQESPNLGRPAANIYHSSYVTMRSNVTDDYPGTDTTLEVPCLVLCSSGL